MAKNILVSVLLLFILQVVTAQSAKEVKWNFTAKKIGDKTYEVHMTANINGNWHMYSQNGGDGPISTTFSFTKNPLLAMTGNVKETGSLKKVFESAFKSDVRYYEKNVDFVQVVKVKSNVKTSLGGKVEFMVCNDRECKPPSEVPFTIAIGG